MAWQVLTECLDALCHQEAAEKASQAGGKMMRLQDGLEATQDRRMAKEIEAEHLLNKLRAEDAKYSSTENAKFSLERLKRLSRSTVESAITEDEEPEVETSGIKKTQDEESQLMNDIDGAQALWNYNAELRGKTLMETTKQEVKSAETTAEVVEKSMQFILFCNKQQVTKGNLYRNSIKYNHDIRI